MTTPKTQAALLISLKDSDFWPADMSLNKWADLVCDELRRLDAENQRLQALLAKLQPAQEPAQAGELPDEREAFEAWVKRECPQISLAWRHSGYFYADSQRAWNAWQARAALAARKPLSVDRIHQIGEALADGSYGPVGGPMECYQFETDTLVEFVRFVEQANGINGLEVRP